MRIYTEEEFQELLAKDTEIRKSIVKKISGVQIYLTTIKKYEEQHIETNQWIKQNILPNLEELQNSDDIRNSVTQLGNSISLNCQTGAGILSDLEQAKEISFADMTASTSSYATLSSDINNFTGSVQLYYQEDPSFSLKMEELDVNREPIEEGLDDLLIELDPDLVKAREAAWHSFFTSSPGSITDACNSMRSILTTLIDRYSRVEAVKLAGWWRPDRDAREGVTKTHKIKYSICGENDSNLEPLDLKRVNQATESCKKAHDALIPVAHFDKRESREIVRSYLRAMEDALLGALTLRKEIELKRRDE